MVKHLYPYWPCAAFPLPGLIQCLRCDLFLSGEALVFILAPRRLPTNLEDMAAMDRIQNDVATCQITADTLSAFTYSSNNRVQLSTMFCIEAQAPTSYLFYTSNRLVFQASYVPSNHGSFQ